MKPEKETDKTLIREVDLMDEIDKDHHLEDHNMVDLFLASQDMMVLSHSLEIRDYMLDVINRGHQINLQFSQPVLDVVIYGKE